MADELVLPETFEVGGLTWSLLCDAGSWGEAERINRENDGPEGNYGLTHFQSCRVFLNPNLGIQQRRATAVHELLHVAAHMAAVPTDDLKKYVNREELFVRAVEPWLTAILTQNPELTAALFLPGVDPGEDDRVLSALAANRDQAERVNATNRHHGGPVTAAAIGGDQ